VEAGLWQQRELDSYTFEDLIDIHELLDTRAENERRQRDWQEDQKQHGH
jgi:hypothetical protein